MDSSLANKFSDGFNSSWIERLLMNLLSYSIVLLPIAFIVIVTKYRSFPAAVQNLALIQWFVYGINDKNASKSNVIEFSDRQIVEAAKPLIDTEQESARQLKPASNDVSSKRNVLGFLWCLSGLQLSYLVWGLLQEKIMTTKYPITNIQSYGAQKDLNLLNNSSSRHSSNSSGDNLTYVTFHDSQFLVFINRIVAFLTAIIALIISQKLRVKAYQTDKYKLVHTVAKSTRNSKPQAPLYEYIYCSLSNILSSWCQYEALKYINFPTQCLSKSCKVVPVMLMSKLLLNKRYPLLDYLCALLLAMGMFIFMFNQSPSNSRNLIKPHDEHGTNNSTKLHDYGSAQAINPLIHDDGRSTLFNGLIILLLYLTFDSFTSNWQQHLYSNYGISKWQMMAAINFYSIMLTLTSLHQLGNLRPAFKLLAQSSVLMQDLLFMSIMSSVGQIFVYHTIERFGSVIFAVIMTLRQFLSILLSCAIYGHRLDFNSCLGLFIVFLVVWFQVWHKSTTSKQTKTLATKETLGKVKTGENVFIQFKNNAN